MAFLRDRQSTGRRAFTLVEILVVIAIIGILLTGITIASFRALASARVNQTRSTIEKIDKMLSSRMAAFDRAMTGRNLAGGDTTDAELLTKYNIDPTNPQSLVAKKQLRAKFFAASFAEPTHTIPPATVLMSDPGPADPLTGAPSPDSELSRLQAQGKYDPAKHRPDTGSAEVLYWFLTSGPTFGSDYQADFNSSEVADTDGDGLLEFVDAWGKPIRFYRWPTRLIRPGPPSAPDTPAPTGAYYPLGATYPGGATTPTAPAQLTADHPASMLIASLPTYDTKGSGTLVDDPTNPGQRPNTQLAHDNEDVDGEVFFQASGGTNSVAAAIVFENLFHTVNTWHAPLIVSAGPDGLLGLYEPHERSSFGHLAQPKAGSSTAGFAIELEDNVTNLNGQASTGGGQ